MSIISYFKGSPIRIVIGKPFSKLTFLRTIGEVFKGYKKAKS